MVQKLLVLINIFLQAQKHMDGDQHSVSTTVKGQDGHQNQTDQQLRQINTSVVVNLLSLPGLYGDRQVS